ncbi:hypothetical protein [Streptomyces sp. NPDC003635]
MRELGIAGTVRGRRVVTTLPGGQVEQAPDLLDRDFVAGAPNRFEWLSCVAGSTDVLDRAEAGCLSLFQRDGWFNRDEEAKPLLNLLSR